MASARKQIEFNEFWPTLRAEAGLRGWSIGEFMKRCKIPRQRYSEFSSGERPLTGMYLVKIMEGLGLSQEDLERKAGRKFTPEQSRERQVESWAAAHRDIIEGLVDFPDLILPIQQLISGRRKK